MSLYLWQQLFARTMPMKSVLGSCRNCDVPEMYYLREWDPQCPNGSDTAHVSCGPRYAKLTLTQPSVGPLGALRFWHLRRAKYREFSIIVHSAVGKIFVFIKHAPFTPLEGIVIVISSQTVTCSTRESRRSHVASGDCSDDWRGVGVSQWNDTKWRCSRRRSRCSVIRIPFNTGNHSNNSNNKCWCRSSNSGEFRWKQRKSFARYGPTRSSSSSQYQLFRRNRRSGCKYTDTTTNRSCLGREWTRRCDHRW